MAVEFDAAANAAAGFNTATMAWNQPVSAGENRIVLIGLSGNAATGAPNGVIAPTVNGNAATLVRAHTTPFGVSFQIEVWSYIVPGTAAATLAVAYDRGTGMQFPIGGSKAYRGVDPVDPVYVSGYVEGEANPLTLAMTLDGLVDGMLADFCVMSDRDGREFFAAAGQTERFQDNNAEVGSTAPRLKGSSKPAAAGLISLSWANISGNQQGGLIGVSLRPAATVSDLAGSLSEGTVLGDELSGDVLPVLLQGSVTEGSDLGDNVSSELIHGATLQSGTSDTAVYGEEYFAELTHGAELTGELTEGAVLGDGVEPVLIHGALLDGAVTEGSVLGDTYVSELIHGALLQASLSEGAVLGTRLGVSKVIDLPVEGVLLGDSVSAQLISVPETIPVAVTEGAILGDTLDGQVIPPGLLTGSIEEGFFAGDTYTADLQHGALLDGAVAEGFSFGDGVAAAVLTPPETFSAAYGEALIVGDSYSATITVPEVVPLVTISRKLRFSREITRTLRF